MEEVLISRTRRQLVTDWHSQFGNYHYMEWRDPISNDGSHPTLSRNVLGLHPNWDTTDSLFHGQQVTVDEKHGIRRNGKDLRDLTAGDIGGDFFSQTKRAYAESKGTINFDLKGKDNTNTWYRTYYDGPCLAVTPLDNMFPVYSQRNLTPLGTTAIARCKPTNNVADLAASILEIFTEGLPKLIGAATWKARTAKALQHAAGDEYLNYEFGWLPLIGDIRSASYAVANAEKILRSYEHNSGLVVRRRYEFPVEKTESTVLIGPSEGILYRGEYYPGLMYDASKPLPKLYKRSRFSRRTWFSGAFTYHLPVDYYSRDKLTQANGALKHLTGLEITPATVWAATPWTWAVDWFTNAGSVITNLSDWSKDGLVLWYGYIMEHTLQEDTYYHDGPTRYQPYGHHHSNPITFSVETKRRQKATPFGFDVTWNTLTPRQLAIAAALGIKRAF